MKLPIIYITIVSIFSFHTFSMTQNASDCEQSDSSDSEEREYCSDGDDDDDADERHELQIISVGSEDFNRICDASSTSHSSRYISCLKKVCRVACCSLPIYAFYCCVMDPWTAVAMTLRQLPLALEAGDYFAQAIRGNSPTARDYLRRACVIILHNAPLELYLRDLLGDDWAKQSIDGIKASVVLKQLETLTNDADYVIKKSVSNEYLVRGVYSADMCPICRSKFDELRKEQINVALLPCKHIICEQCCDRCVKEKQTTCECGKNFAGKVIVIFVGCVARDAD